MLVEELSLTDNFAMFAYKSARATRSTRRPYNKYRSSDGLFEKRKEKKKKRLIKFAIQHDRWFSY